VVCCGGCLWLYLLHLWLIFFNLSDCVCVLFLLGSVDAFGWDFFFYRAGNRVKRGEGDNCGGGASKGLEVGGFGELG
jgi:hypothetical protein